MATTISQRIALDGGEEIARQFESMRAAGVKASDEIDRQFLQTTQTLNRFVAAVARVETSFAAVGTSAAAFGKAVAGTARSFGQFETALGRTVRNVALFTASIAAGNIGLLKFVKDAANAADALEEQAVGLGTTAEKLQAFKGAAAQTGISSEKLALGITALNKILVDDSAKAIEAAQARIRKLGISFAPTEAGAKGLASATARLISEMARLQDLTVVKNGIKFQFPDTEEGRKAAAALRDSLRLVSTDAQKAESALKRLGVSAIDPLTGKVKDPIDAILDLSNEFKKLPDGVEKARLAADLFGSRVGRRFVALLNLGSAGIRGLTAQFAQLQKTGPELTIGSKFADSLDLLAFSAKEAKDKLALLFAPSLTSLAGAFTKSILGNFNTLSSGLQNFVRTKFEPIVRDIIRLLQGGADTVPLKSGIFGNTLGDARKTFEEFKKGVVAGANAISTAFRLIADGANIVAKFINDIFGTKFTGATLLATAGILKLVGGFGLLIAAFRVGAAALVAFGAGLRLLIAGFAALTAAGGLLRFAPLLLAGLNPVTIAAGLALIVALFVGNREAIAKEWAKLPPELRKTTENIGKSILDEIKKSFGARQTDTLSSFFKRSFEEAFTFDEKKLQNNVDKAKEILSGAGTVALDWIAKSFTDAFDAVLVKAQAFIDELKRIFTQSPVQGGSTAPEIPAPPQSGAQPGAIQQPGLSQLDAQASQAATSVQGLGQSAQAAAAAEASSAQGLLVFDAALQQSASEIANSGAGAEITAAVQGLAAEFQAAASGLDRTATEAAQVEQAFDPLSTAAQELARAFQQAAGGLDSGGGGFARGGFVSGPGTSKSDSILARLSRGEYVVNAKATSKYLPLLRAINGMRFRMPKFNMGGLADGMARALSPLAFPGFANGGEVQFAAAAARSGGGSPVTLNIFEGGVQQTFDLWADEEVAEKVSRYAQVKVLKSAGRR